MPMLTDIPSALGLYRAMLRIRLVEETIADRYAQQRMRCPVHLSIGQEAVAAGVSAALASSDQIFSTHRCHAHYLAKGGDLTAMIAEIHGKETGCCGGRGGSMNLVDPDAGVMMSSPTIGSSIPVAVGAALSMQQRGTGGVAVAYFGDGASEEGVLHESLNFAALRRLPVLFVLENNGYSIFTPLDQRQPAQRPLSDLGRAHGIPAETVDGNDAGAVRAAAGRAVGRARRGEGPTLLVCDTYRQSEHCEPAKVFDVGYRTAAEREEWAARCPLTRLRHQLIAEGILTKEAEAALLRSLRTEVEEAFADADAAPFPSPVNAMEHLHVR